MTKSLLSDLRSAFAGEAMTVQRYTYFAQVAEIEGHVEVSRLFTELAESVACAAHGHVDFLLHSADPTTGRPLGETPLNVAAAVSGELHEATERYPKLVAAAHAEGMADLASWLTTLCALKKAHVAKLEQALAGLSEPPLAATSANGTEGGERP
ncbi:rubrerythrin family protein [Saccharothrix australiensis]|uniref:rubrerythrin family protein n=1 Tax=Saccharothrix australiensis TaxID=2072 RepID=UPI001B869510|nr:rubrerythrin family protein [Saccharothrix australiensis]